MLATIFVITILILAVVSLLWAFITLFTHNDRVESIVGIVLIVAVLILTPSYIVSVGKQGAINNLRRAEDQIAYLTERQNEMEDEIALRNSSDLKDNKTCDCLAMSVIEIRKDKKQAIDDYNELIEMVTLWKSEPIIRRFVKDIDVPDFYK